MSSCTAPWIAWKRRQKRFTRPWSRPCARFLDCSGAYQLESKRFWVGADADATKDQFNKTRCSSRKQRIKRQRVRALPLFFWLDLPARSPTWTAISTVSLIPDERCRCWTLSPTLAPSPGETVPVFQRRLGSPDLMGPLLRLPGHRYQSDRCRDCQRWAELPWHRQFWPLPYRLVPRRPRARLHSQSWVIGRQCTRRHSAPACRWPGFSHSTANDS